MCSELSFATQPWVCVNQKCQYPGLKSTSAFWHFLRESNGIDGNVVANLKKEYAITPARKKELLHRLTKPENQQLFVTAATRKARSQNGVPPQRDTIDPQSARCDEKHKPKMGDIYQVRPQINFKSSAIKSMRKIFTPSIK